MTAPAIRINVGSAVSVTGANAIASGAYAAQADALRIQNTAGALLADFRLTRASGNMFATAPVAGALQLIAVDRDLSGNPGPVPSAALLGRLVGAFTPTPSTGNTAQTWVMSVNSVALSPDCDFYIYNNGTAQALAANWVLTAQPWSPGS